MKRRNVWLGNAGPAELRTGGGHVSVRRFAKKWMKLLKKRNKANQISKCGFLQVADPRVCNQRFVYSYYLSAMMYVKNLLLFFRTPPNPTAFPLMWLYWYLLLADWSSVLHLYFKFCVVCLFVVGVVFISLLAVRWLVSVGRHSSRRQSIL